MCGVHPPHWEFCSVRAQSLKASASGKARDPRLAPSREAKLRTCTTGPRGYRAGGGCMCRGAAHRGGHSGPALPTPAWGRRALRRRVTPGSSSPSLVFQTCLLALEAGLCYVYVGKWLDHSARSFRQPWDDGNHIRTEDTFEASPSPLCQARGWTGSWPPPPSQTSGLEFWLHCSPAV